MSWPLIGRAEELELIAAALRRRDGPRGIVLAGAAGVGKTRLAREAVAIRRGRVTRWATATASARGVPLGVFSGWLSRWDGDPLQAVRRATELLLDGGDGADVVVVVDDAHLLDELSASVVHQLVQQGAATVVITVRSGEPAPDAVACVWKDGFLDRVEVQPLSKSEVAELLEGVLGGPVDSAASARLWTLTQGNALFLRQVVDEEREGGRLHEQGSVWWWSGRPVIAPVLTELVEARLGRLPEPLNDAVDLLALGEPLGVRILGDLVEAATVELAETRGLVVVDRDGRRLEARLSHPLFGEVRRARMGELRKRRLRGRLATAIAATGSRRAHDTLRRAVLAVDSDLEPEPAVLTAAARDAMLLVDLPLAVRLARAAVTAGGGVDALLILAWALSGLSRGEEACAALAAVANEATTDQQRTVAGVMWAGNMYFSLRDPDEAEAALAATLDQVAEPVSRHMVTAMQAAFDGMLGRSERAVEGAATAFEEPALPGQSVMSASYGMITALGSLGRADELAPIAARAHAAADHTPEVGFMRFGLVDLHLAALWQAGYVDEAERQANEHGRNSDGMPEPLRLYGVGLMGMSALYSGRVMTSIRFLRQALAGLAPFESTGFALSCLLRLTQAYAIAADRESARTMLADLEAHEHPGFAYRAPEMRLVRAWVAAADGAITEAIAVAHEAAEIAATRAHPAQELLALHTAVCFGDPTPATRLAYLATHVDGPRGPAAASHAAALATNDGDALLAASHAQENYGDLLAAIDSAAQASTAHTRIGHRTAAHLAATRAQRLAARCEGARTPALAAALNPLPLTGREREIVTLAAQGLTNQQIAARLFVSIRTVEGHLYRAGTKLGTSNRATFASLLGNP